MRSWAISQKSEQHVCIENVYQANWPAALCLTVDGWEQLKVLICDEKESRGCSSDTVQLLSHSFSSNTEKIWLLAAADCRKVGFLYSIRHYSRFSKQLRGLASGSLVKSTADIAHLCSTRTCFFTDIGSDMCLCVCVCVCVCVYT